MSICFAFSFAISFVFVDRAMNSKMNQRIGLEKLVRKRSTSFFDMPSSQRCEAKREKMPARATPEEEISGSCQSGDFVFGASAVLLR